VELLEIESGSGAGGAPCGPESGEHGGGESENDGEESDGRAEFEAEGGWFAGRRDEGDQRVGELPSGEDTRKSPAEARSAVSVRT